MKKIKRIFALLLAVCMSVSILCTSAFAAGDQSIVYNADGSYTVTIITINHSCASARSSTQVKSGEKEIRHYDSSDRLMWAFRVIGTFSYDGRNAEATLADYSYDIYDSVWSFNGGSASYSGATATATGSFTRAVIPNSVSVSLTCSPKGVLS